MRTTLISAEPVDIGPPGLILWRRCFVSALALIGGHAPTRTGPPPRSPQKVRNQRDRLSSVPPSRIPLAWL